MNNSVVCQLKKTGAGFLKADSGAAGYDIHAAHAATIAPGSIAIIHTDIYTSFPPGVVALLFSRSGNAVNRKLVLANQVGVIDSSYRGEWLVALRNVGDVLQVVTPGDRIAQAVFMPYMMPLFEVVETLDDTERGTGGFGSSGK